MSQTNDDEPIPAGHKAETDGEMDTAQSTEPTDDRNPRHYKYKQTASLSRVTKKRNAITNLMVDEDNLHIVKSELMVFNEYCVMYQSAHVSLCDVLHSENDTDIEIKRYEDRQTSIIDFRGQVADWIRKAERHLSDDCESASRAGSARSSRSSQSTVSAIAIEKARIAELMIEKGMLRKQHNLRIQLDELTLEVEIAKAQARERIYLADNSSEVIEDKHVRYPLEPVIAVMTTSQMSDHSATVSDTNIRANGKAQCDPPGHCQTPTMWDADAPSFVPLRNTFTDDSQGHLITTNSLLAALSLPQPEVHKFSGDLMMYTSFMAAFDSRIASRTNSSADSLYYLEQHLLGEPKEVISGCLHLDPELGYIEARKLLDKEYGDPYKLSIMLLNTITDWPVLKQGDNAGIKHFSLFLNKCNNAMKSLSYLHVLNDPSNMLCVVQKLPFYLQNKWRDHASKARRREQRILIYSDLVEFVSDAADTANDPVYGTTALVHHTMSHHDGYHKSKFHKADTSTATHKTANFATDVSSANNHLDQYASSCLFCKQRHDLDHCKAFTNKTIEDRREFIKEKRLCFACYGTDHFSKACTHKRKCNICAKPHPTALHLNDFVISRTTSYNAHNGRQNEHD